LLLSALILSVLFTCIISGYFAIILTRKSSYIFRILMNRNISPVIFYLWSVLIINTISLVILIIFGILYFYLSEKLSNHLIIYFLVTSLFNLLIIFLVFLIKGKVNKHIMFSILFFAIISSVLYPLFLSRFIN
jgi:hypothetical protein